MFVSYLHLSRRIRLHICIRWQLSVFDYRPVPRNVDWRVPKYCQFDVECQVLCSAEFWPSEVPEALVEAALLAMQPELAPLLHVMSLNVHMCSNGYRWHRWQLWHRWHVTICLVSSHLSSMLHISAVFVATVASWVQVEAQRIANCEALRAHPKSSSPGLKLTRSWSKRCGKQSWNRWKKGCDFRCTQQLVHMTPGHLWNIWPSWVHLEFVQPYATHCFG